VETKNSEVTPFLLEVVKNALDTIADELALIIMRTAYSSIVRDAMDYSTAICDASGQTLAQGLTTPLHLGSFFDAMKNLVDNHAPDAEAGDVYIFNDPYLAAGQHLPDVYIVRPIFIDGAIEGWATTVAHLNDVGGIVPGSNSIGSTEIYQEGLRLPVLKLYSAGKESQTIWDIVSANVRIPDKVLGDIKAQVSACLVGEREFTDLFKRYGRDTLRKAFSAIHDYSEGLARAEFSDMKDGVYRFTNHIDGIGDNPEPITFNVALTIKGSDITVDWTGTSPVVRGGINSPFPFTKAAAYAALRSVLGVEVPNAQGFTRAITVIAERNSIVNPLPPAACGARGITGFRMIDCIMGALAQVVPERVPADGSGGSTIPSIGGIHRDRPFIFVETMMGTWGGAPTHDGQDGVAHIGANQSNIPIEMIEREHPLRYEKYALVADSAGPGRFRGGLAIERQVRLLAEEAVISVRSDKRRYPPYGLHGGAAGSPSMNVINPGAGERLLPVLFKEPVNMKRDDVFRHVLASGGGYGDPLTRDVELVRKDLIQERVTVQGAFRDYGVVAHTSGRHVEIDAHATKMERQARMSPSKGAA
jgi:N-methylhydantoinase B